MKIGALNFFPAFSPPKSGGEKRYWHLYSRLGRWHDVEMVNPTYGHHARERVVHGPRVVEHRIPKNGRYNWWHRFFDRVGKFRECSGLVAGLSAAAHPELVAEAARLARESDVLIHEFPFLYRLAPRPRQGQLFVYDAHNVEYLMAREMFPGLVGRWAAGRVRALERDCARAADLVLACSDDDAARLVELYGLDPLKLRVVPNGVDPGAIRPADAGERPAIRRRLGLHGARPAVLFFGSFHPPNIEAVDFIRRELAPRVEGADFLVAGRVCRAINGAALPANVRALGEVDDAAARDLFQGCDAAINPMFTGSGTNVKMLDYLAAGLPTVSSARGARGLSIVDGRHARVVEPARMHEALAALIERPAEGRALALEGRRLVESAFSWDAIAESVHNLFTLKTQRRVILLNDFPASPPTTGGRARLTALGRRLAETGHGTTILTLSTEAKPRAVHHAPLLEELNVPRSRAHRSVDLWLAHRLNGVGADDVTAYRFGGLTRAFGRTLRREARFARVAVFAHPYMIAARRHLPDGVALLHDSYNVESELKRQIYGEGIIARWLQRAVRRLEGEALRESAIVACVSDEDLATMRRVYPAFGESATARTRAFVSPNGVDCRGLSVLSWDEKRRLRASVGLGPEPFVLFLGSGHPPNRDAAKFILDALAPAVPEAQFLIIGQVCGWFVSYRVPANAALFGIVSDAAKDFLLQVSDVAVNPMFQGSGTSLKVSDALAAGLPVVATAVGARGVGDWAGDSVVIREPDAFAQELRSLLADRAGLARRSEQARRVALEHFDWSVTLKGLVEEIDRLMSDEKAR